ncbi:MAG: hypothetical protein HY063_12110 [Bacteroidetes bacterium]|nr:hypothetical protein [Bacteroidota bacterium]
MKKDFPTFSISEIEKGIAFIEYKGIEMGLKEIIELYDEIENFGNGKKIAILNTFKEFIPSNEETMKYVEGERPPKLLYASAIVVESLATRLAMMMFMRFNKQRVPRKVFNSKKKAMKWLREMSRKKSD